MIVSPLETPQHYIDRFRSEFPDLQVEAHQKAFKSHEESKDEIPEDAWRDVTILLLLSGLPDAAKVPKLQLVQLFSAGANQVMEHPLFTDTDIAFCTANGTHG